MTNEKQSLAAVCEEGERLLQMATEGHWHVEYPMDDIGISIVVDGPTPEAYDWRHIGMIDFDSVIAGDSETDYPITKEQAEANAALIVHLHNNAEALFAAAKEAEGLREECRRLEQVATAVLRQKERYEEEASKQFESLADEASTQRTRAETAEAALRMALSDVCSLRCPSVWKTGERPPHSEECRRIQSIVGEVMR